jgi:hypothetical protein
MDFRGWMPNISPVREEGTERAVAGPYRLRRGAYMKIVV